MRKISLFILKLFGWTRVLLPEEPEKFVLCVAPHTSNWDFIFGLLFYNSVNYRFHIIMKKEWFVFPLNYFFKSIVVLPIDRKKRDLITNQMTEKFSSEKDFKLAITPEGTRSRNPKWKTGFYYIALNAGVPIVLGVIDYSKKEIGYKKIFYPTGDVKSDIDEIKNFYNASQAKYPKKFANNIDE